MKNSKVRKGDVLLNITGGSLGRCFYVDSNEEMNVNQHVCIIRPNKKINTKKLFIYFSPILFSWVLLSFHLSNILLISFPSISPILYS